jgi:hypothetical protein
VSAPRSPLLWRKIAKPPQWYGMNTMARMLWSRDTDHGLAVELVCAGEVLATARVDGRWFANTLGGSGKADFQSVAKAEALAFVRKALADAKAGEP